MNVWDITRIVRRGGHRLSESTWEYWPQNGNNEISERNISINQTVTFADAGFLSYAEVHSGESTRQRTDLFMIHPQQRAAVVMECKRLYNAAQCEAMVWDLERILQFEPREEEIQTFQRFGILAATTWNSAIACWWSSLDGPIPQGESWGRLDSHPRLAKAHWGSVVLLGYEEKRTLESPFHYLLYTVFEIQPEA